ncbi:MAG: hypothetical protein QOJ84_1857 [Bradyrhizobium sp.]|nr:hypothetical protein [Bradyrhizobium sp.]
MQLLNIGDRLAAIELTDSTPDELGAFIKAETERWALADGVTRHLGTSVSTSFAKARVFGQHRARDGGAETEAAIGGLLDRSHLGNFLYVDDQARSHDAGAHCTSRSVPPARTRAALPAPANALIASSSVRGAKYRTSVMVIPAVSLIRAPHVLVVTADAGSLHGQKRLEQPVSSEGPYASSG